MPTEEIIIDHDYTNRLIALLNSVGISIEEMINADARTDTTFLNRVSSRIYNIYFPEDKQVENQQSYITLRQFCSVSVLNDIEVVECIDGVPSGAALTFSPVDIAKYNHLDSNIISIFGTNHYTITVYVDISEEG